MSWNELTIKDKATVIRLAVALGLRNLDDIHSIYDEFSYNQLKGGGTANKKSNSKPAVSVRKYKPTDILDWQVEGRLQTKHKERQDEFLRHLEDWFKAHPDSEFNTPEWRQYITSLPIMEGMDYMYGNDANLNAENSVQARGYFQMMPGSRRTKGLWKNQMDLFNDYMAYLKTNNDFINKNTTKEEREYLESLGFDIYALNAAAHLGGVGNYKYWKKNPLTYDSRINKNDGGTNMTSYAMTYTLMPKYWLDENGQMRADYDVVDPTAYGRFALAQRVQQPTVTEQLPPLQIGIKSLIDEIELPEGELLSKVDINDTPAAEDEQEVSLYGYPVRKPRVYTLPTLNGVYDTIYNRKPSPLEQLVYGDLIKGLHNNVLDNVVACGGKLFDEGGPKSVLRLNEDVEPLKVKEHLLIEPTGIIYRGNKADRSIENVGLHPNIFDPEAGFEEARQFIIDNLNSPGFRKRLQENIDKGYIDKDEAEYWISKFLDNPNSVMRFNFSDSFVDDDGEEVWGPVSQEVIDDLTDTGLINGNAGLSYYDWGYDKDTDDWSMLPKHDSLLSMIGFEPYYNRGVLFKHKLNKEDGIHADNTGWPYVFSHEFGHLLDAMFSKRETIPDKVNTGNKVEDAVNWFFPEYGTFYTDDLNLRDEAGFNRSLPYQTLLLNPQLFDQNDASISDLVANPNNAWIIPADNIDIPKEIGISESRLFHDYKPGENYGDIWELRKKLADTGIYDSRSVEPITKQQLEEYKAKVPPEHWGRIFDNQEDDVILYLLNHTALNLNNSYSQPIFYAAYGGRLFDVGGPTKVDVYPLYAKGGSIHINPKNKGKFSAAAKRAGMSTQQYASHVLANKGKYSSTLVKRANFARNASKWKHPDGGPLKNNYMFPANISTEDDDNYTIKVGENSIFDRIKNLSNPYFSISGRNFATLEEAQADNEAYRIAKDLTEQTNEIPVTFAGGTKEQAREKFWQLEPVLRHAVDSVADLYNVSPQALKYRINQEGFVDDQVKLRNLGLGIMRPERGYELLNKEMPEAGGFGFFGLDYLGDYLRNGDVEIKGKRWYRDKNTGALVLSTPQYYVNYFAENEHDLQVDPATGRDVADNIGGIAATLAMFKEQAKKDFPNATDELLNKYSLAYYNRGRAAGRRWIKQGHTGYDYTDTPVNKKEDTRTVIEKQLLTNPTIRQAWNMLPESARQEAVKLAEKHGVRNIERYMNIFGLRANGGKLNTPLIYAGHKGYIRI